MSDAGVPPEAAAAARRLLGGGVSGIALAGAGANSRIYRVDRPEGPAALKSYPPRIGDTRGRQDAEWRALAFLRGNGVAQVPEPIARDDRAGYTAIEWIDGSPIPDPSDADVEEAMDFAAAVFGLSRRPDAASFPPASEACLSAAEIVRQVRARLEAFAPHAELDAFLRDEFRPAFAPLERAAGADGAGDLPAALRRLIPADFGFHNALRRPDGRIAFFDFEYFGWDDPAKLVADFLLHPAFALTARQRLRAAERAAEALPDDPGFADRLRRTLPLYRLRWCLILLNPFRRDRIARAGAGLLHSAQDEQLAKARRMLADGADA